MQTTVIWSQIRVRYNTKLVNMDTGYYILKYSLYGNAKLTHCLRVPGVGSASTYSS